MSVPALAGDPAAGKAVFQANCSICHSAIDGKTMVGPSLFGIVGRKTGSVTGYAYSEANRTADLIWDDATLETYLQAPRETIRGTKMVYAGLKDPIKRDDLIAYLVTLKP